MNRLRLASEAKGSWALLNRISMIAQRYSLTPISMDRALAEFSSILDRFHCRATFPTVAVVVTRHPALVSKLYAEGIEVAVHGYAHIDYRRLALEQQVAHLRRARDVFASMGIRATGFRSPYLQFNENLHVAAREVGFEYVCDQPVLWNVLGGEPLSAAGQTACERAIEFYRPLQASDWPTLPCLCGELVEIPVSLPDDEILTDRLGGHLNGLVERAWSRILQESYQREELFTIQLHPERIAQCAPALSALLTLIQSLNPTVWVARLDEIAAWWRSRSEANVTVTNTGEGQLCLNVKGPEGTVFLVRHVQVEGPTRSWARGYQMCETQTLVLKSPVRPFIGVPPGAHSGLVSFLRQQGYIVEAGQDRQGYAVYLEQTDSMPSNPRSLLASVEENGKPLVKLGRWPNGARSALAITGDIDALTLWDYGPRYLAHWMGLNWSKS